MNHLCLNAPVKNVEKLNGIFGERCLYFEKNKINSQEFIIEKKKKKHNQAATILDGDYF